MSRNLHDDDLRLRCPGCSKVFKTREGVANHVRSSLHGEWITDFSMPEEGTETDRDKAEELITRSRLSLAIEVVKLRQALAAREAQPCNHAWHSFPAPNSWGASCPACQALAVGDAQHD